MFGRRIWRFCRLFVVVSLPWMPLQVQAKTAGLTAIVVYPGNNGQNVAQVSNFVLDQKNEVYRCAGLGKMDESAYHRLKENKVILTAGMTLEVDAQGVLMLSSGSEPATCVVPGNLKLEKDESLSPAALAVQGSIEASVLPGSDPPIVQMPSLKPGTLIVFVPTANPELANYLRAQRQGDVAGWKRYLSGDAGGAHVSEARKALATLYVKAAHADLESYLASKTGEQLNFTKLAEARQMSDQAQAQAGNDAAAADLSKRIHAEVVDLSQQSASKLDLYRTAMKNRSAGYNNLVEAEVLADGAYLAEPSTSEANSAEQQSKMERAKLEKALHDTDHQIASQHPDEAAMVIAPYQAFKDENTRVESDLRGISSLWIARAKKSESTSDWPGAVSDLEKAQALLPLRDTLSLLTAAQQQAHTAANQAAVQAAMQKSQDAEASGDLIRAYEVLDDLPPEQHGQVTERLQSLQEQYVTTAEAQAKKLQKAYEPINGTSDEQGIVEAYELTQRCLRLTEDPALKDQSDILASDLATYYLKQADKYADKPDGIGMNIAWAYLSEALHYSSPSNSGDVRDEIERIRARHRIKAGISVRVEFRDSTSRRDSVDFATQLTDAMATGLESTGLNVLVIRPTDMPPVAANFHLIGDVIQHDLGKQLETIPRQSKYKSGERPVTNPDWAKANREYDEAKDELQMARTELQDALNKNKKKDIETAKKGVSDAERKLNTLNARISSTQQFNMVPVIDSYNYVEKIIHVSPTVVIQFRITDATGTEVVPEIPVKEEIPNQYSQFEGVMPTDTEGIHAKAEFEPDDADFYRTSEYAARDALVKQAKQKVASLPEIVLAQADRRAANEDADGAAEMYILYLNSTPNSDTPERRRAKAYLAKQFNFGDLALQAPPS